MKTLDFNIMINAPREQVWKQLWSDEGYRKWTSVFSEGSYAESDWQEGSKIRFLSPDGGGLFGIIKKKQDNEMIIFEHHGEVKEGKEYIKDWGGSSESYYLKDISGTTELVVKLDAPEEFTDYFNTTFPKALEVVKQISEA